MRHLEWLHAGTYDQASIIRNTGQFSYKFGPPLLHHSTHEHVQTELLVDPKWPYTERFVSEWAAALAVGQELIVLDVKSDREIEIAFTTLIQHGAGALHAGIGGFMNTQRERVVALAARHRITAIYNWREAVAAGGLMSYAPSIADAYRQAGVYAGRILKGEKPGDLPVLLPTKFEFVINLKTARTLGLTIPSGVLAIVDEVIE